MLVLEEVNRVRGAALPEFEQATRRFWNEAKGCGATAAWSFEVSHGTGPSYCVLTGLRVPDWTVWETLARSMATGNLSTVTESLDLARHDSVSSLHEVVSELAGEPATAGHTTADRTVDDGNAGQARTSKLWIRCLDQTEGSQVDPQDGEPQAEGSRLVMRSVLGDDAGQRTTHLHQVTPTRALELLAGDPEPADRFTSSPYRGAPRSVWVLRPSPWSPLQ